MSLQVGAFCYATPADAGRAACSQWQPVVNVSGNIIKSVTCYDINAVNGALFLRVATTDTSIPSTTFQNVSHLLSYPACVEQDYLVAAEIVIAGLLALYVTWLCGWKILSYLGWTRGENV